MAGNAHVRSKSGRNIRSLLTTILIYNNVVNITASAVSSRVLGEIMMLAPIFAMIVDSTPQVFGIYHSRSPDRRADR